MRRALVVSLPMVTWADLPLDAMPNLRTLLSQSLVADLSIRGVGRHPTLGDAYVTVSAGTRAVGNQFDNEGLMRDEQFEEGTACDAWARRSGQSCGRAPAGSVLALAYPTIVDRNDSLLFDAHPGALGDALQAAGISRSVIGNADHEQPATRSSSYGRQVANMLASSAGVTPGGDVSAGLLRADATAPFGLALDPVAVQRAFETAWSGRAVVTVEDSDLVRFDADRRMIPPMQRGPIQDRLLTAFDAMLGRMLAAVDPARDAVMVIGPTSARGSPAELTVAAVRAPGVQPGLAESGVTRRAGFVSIVDVAPTILDLFQVAAPDSMEGRPFELGRTGGTFSDRRAFLVAADRAALFRDARVANVTDVLMFALVGLAAAALIAFARLGRSARSIVELASFGLLGALPATFLAGIFSFEHHGVLAYWLFIVATAALVGVGAVALGRRTRVDALLLVLALVVGVHVVDVMTGARLQFSTVFGYSPIVAGRFAGIGNLAYSQLSAAALVMAGLIGWRVAGRSGTRLAVVLLVLVVVVDGAPIWGSDVGGVLSMVPAFAVAATALLGWKVRRRTIGWGLGGAAALVAVFAAIDLSRSSDRQTHLGRLVSSSRSGGWRSLRIVIERKLSENWSVFFHSWWTLVVPIVVATVAALFVLVARGDERVMLDDPRLRRLRSLVPAAVVLAVLGFALNDSGIAIPGMMLAVFTPSAIVVLVQADRGRSGSSPADLHRPDRPVEVGV